MHTITYDKNTGEIVNYGSMPYDPEITVNMLKPDDENLDIIIAESTGSAFQYVKDGVLTDYTELQRLAKQNKPKGLPATWSNETFTWTIVDNRTLEQLKTAKKDQITQLRETKNLEPITYQNSLFDCDETAQRNIQAWTTNINAGTNPPEGFVWRDYNNVDHAANASFVLGLNAAVVARGTQLYQTSWTKKAEVDALTTAEQVNAYDVTTGW